MKIFVECWLQKISRQFLCRYQDNGAKRIFKLLGTYVELRSFAKSTEIRIRKYFHLLKNLSSYDCIAQFLNHPISRFVFVGFSDPIGSSWLVEAFSPQLSFGVMLRVFRWRVEAFTMILMAKRSKVAQHTGLGVSLTENLNSVATVKAVSESKQFTNSFPVFSAFPDASRI